VEAREGVAVGVAFPFTREESCEAALEEKFPALLNRDVTISGRLRLRSRPFACNVFLYDLKSVF